MKFFLFFGFIVWSALFFNDVFATGYGPESRVQIKNQKGENLIGVYMVNKTGHYLITCSDEEGNCYYDPEELASSDSIQFASLGYKAVVLIASDLKSRAEIQLSEKAVILNEVAVRAVKPEVLLKKAALMLQQRSKGADFLINYYGKGQYMKLTECLGRAVEYRRSYGCFFTSGNVMKKGKFDNNHCFYFVPAYVARSYTLTADGRDTLYPLRMYFNNIRKAGRDYDAGVKHIYDLMRSIELYGPLYTDLRYYDFRLVDNEGGYTYEFRTRASNKLKDIPIVCNGLLTIDPESGRLQKLVIDYIDYNMVSLTNWPDWVSCPYATRAEIEISWKEDGKSYIRKCLQTTEWKKNEKYDPVHPENTFIGDFPSRRNPGKYRLIEKEAFVIYDYRPFPEECQKELRYYSAIKRASYNECGIYDVSVFSSLEEPLNAEQARKDLSEYMDIEKQFQSHHYRPYWSGEYFSENLDITRKVFGDITFDQYAALLEQMRRRIVGRFLTEPAEEMDFYFNITDK